MTGKVEKKNPYILPSQRLMNIQKELSTTKNPVGAVDFSIMVSLAILDKLEEVTLLLRQPKV